MSLSAPAQFTGGTEDQTASSTVSTDEILELLSDDCVCKLLGSVYDESKSARTLAEECGVSRATVYRRLNRLQAAGLVTEQMEYDSDGHHRQTFTAAVETVGITLGDSGFEASLSVEDH